MKIKSIVILLAFLLILTPLVFSQSKETGAIVGTIVDEEGAPLPGVTVALKSPAIMGEKSAITDAEGQFRFPALRPGLYSVRAALPGFATVVREDIRLHTTARLTVDMTLRVSAIEEEVTVIAESPTVDVKTSETASVTLSDEILRAMPTSQFVSDIVNLAPGVDGNVAYGGTSSGLSYQVDGVDVGDPEGGTAWVFLDYNIVEEAKVMGLGLNAEYGAFSGVIFNTITKSGGNDFSGHAEIIYQSTNKNGFWTTDNNQVYLDENPGLTSPLQGLWDSSVHLGGPIKKDKHWFFLGLQYYNNKERPTGLEAPHWRDYKQPRFFLKLTSQLSSKINATAWLELDRYNGINRNTGVTNPVPETGVKQTSPEWVVNLDLTAVLNPTTFFNIKAAYFWGYYYLDAQGGDATPVWSAADNRWYDNSYYWYKADRTRFQANASISNYAEDFIAGDHDFKFGTEFERGWSRSRLGYPGYVEGIGPSVYIYDYYGYLYAYQYEGYDTNTHYIRNEWFLQDAWSISDTLTINLGLRWSFMRGYVKGVSGSVYSTDRPAPRVGLAWDIFGDHTTVLKGHYGRFTDAMYTYTIVGLNPPESFSDFIGYYWDGEWIEWARWPFFQTEFADSYSHPYMDQWTVGIERELFKDASLGISYINRKWRSILNKYDKLGQYEIETVYDPYTGDPIDVYNQTNVGERQYVMANIKKGDPWIADDAYRDYWGIEVLFTKRFSHRWQLIASYIYSECTGTMGTGWLDDAGWGGNTHNPNFWINRAGHVYNDPTHFVKLQGSYVLPWDIHFNAYFKYRTGRTYTRQARFRLDQGRETIFTEAAGSRRLPNLTNLDLRLEKTIAFKEKYRLGLMIDIFNVFNADTITDWGDRTEYDWYEDLSDYTSSDGHQVYSLVAPRAIRLGVRFFF